MSEMEQKDQSLEGVSVPVGLDNYNVGKAHEEREANR